MSAYRVTAGLVCTLTVFASGCQHVVLERRTNQQTSQLPDLYYHQVLNNIAAFAANPAALPHFAYAGTGLTQVQRTAGSGSSLTSTGTLTAFFFSALSFTPNASQVVSESWTTVASVEPDELYLMRCVYQRTVGACPADCEPSIRQFFGESHVALAAMQPGWYCVGSKHDVPSNAAYVGRHDDTYVWVMPDQVENLSLMVLAMVDVATADVDELGERTTPVDQDRRRIQELEERVLFLSGVLANYPPAETEASKALRKELDNTVLALLLKTKNLSKENFLSGVARPKSFTNEEEKNIFENDLERRYNEAKRLADQPPRQAPLPQGPIPSRQRRQPIAPTFPPVQPLGGGS